MNSFEMEPGRTSVAFAVIGCFPQMLWGERR